jgi:hypothetical protein
MIISDEGGLEERAEPKPTGGNRMPNLADYFQMASDFDGDLYLFPKNLEEPNYQRRWRVWIIEGSGESREALPSSAMMCVTNGKVTNPLGVSGHCNLEGWCIDSISAEAVEIQLDGQSPIRFEHPFKSYSRQLQGHRNNRSNLKDNGQS